MPTEFCDMTVAIDSVPDGALEDIAYLSRSDNRLLVLTALTEGPHTRRELEEVTGVSRATVGRIVNEFEERNWAERTTDGDYVATSTGHHIATQFIPFAESIEAIRRLGEALEWLPTDELSIGLCHFRDTIVRRPEQDDPMEIIDYFTDLIRDASEFRTLTHFAPTEAFAETMRDRLATNRLTATYVLTSELVEYLRDHRDRRDRWRDCLEAGADVYRYRGHIPCNLFIIDQKVLIKKSGPESVQESYAVPIESENEAVRSWAHELIDRYQEHADQLDIETFSAGRQYQ